VNLGKFTQILKLLVVKICIANCGQTLLIAQQAIFCHTIADYLQLPPE